MQSFPPGLEPDSFTYASIGSEGGKLTLADWGVSLLVPKGALDPGYLEEVSFLPCLFPSLTPSPFSPLHNDH